MATQAHFSTFKCPQCKSLEGTFEDLIEKHDWTKQDGNLSGNSYYDVKHKGTTITNVFTTSVYACKNDGTCNRVNGVSNKAMQNHVHKAESKTSSEDDGKISTEPGFNPTYKDIVAATKDHFQSSAYRKALDR